jgi:hypothetical protein
MGGHSLVGRLSGIRTQSGIVSASKCVIVYRNFGAAAVPEGECGPCPIFASIYIPAFALQLRKNHGKISVGVAEKRLTQQGWRNSFGRLRGSLRATSTGLLTVTAFGLRLGRLGPALGQISAELPN